MANARTLTAEQQEVARGQNQGIELFSDKREERVGEVNRWLELEEQEKAAIAKAKEEAEAEYGAKQYRQSLEKARGWNAHTLKFCRELRKMPLATAAAALRQAIEWGKDEEIILPDFFDNSIFGSARADDGKAVFDSTSEGQRRGGADAQPRTVEEMAASHQPAPTPGVPLDEALRQLEAYKAANEERLAKRGPKPAEFKRLTEQVEQARAAEAASAEQAGAEELPELPEAKPGEISAAMSEAAAGGDAHLEKATRSRRTRKAKAEEPAQEAAPEPAADDDDEQFPGAPVPAGIGTTAPTFRIG